MALVVAWWAQALVGTFAIPIDEPQHVDLSPDGRVVGFVVLLVCIAGVLPGLWPALAAARVNVSRVLTAQSANSAGGRPSVLGRWLIGAQIAGSTAFLALAALFIQSYFHLLSVDLGFARDHLVLAEFEPAAHGRAGQDAERYAAALQDRVLSVPGVEAIAIADRAPFFIGFDRETAVWPAGGRCDSDSCPKTAFYVIGPGYFRALGIPMMAGREFAALHTSGEVVINEAFARRQWPNGGGLGETIRVGISGTALTVVGIAGRTHMRGVDRERPHIFLPLTTGDFDKELTLVARTAIAPSLLLRAVTEAAREIDPHMPLLSAKSMEQRTAVQLWPFRTLSLMFTICGLLALLLAVIGLAGVVIHAVSRRMREFGVRMSCGATPRDLMSDVLRDGWKLLMPGLAAGILITIAAAHMAQAAFVGVNVLNPLTYAIVVLVQCVIVALACVGPARRAARVDPLVALRSE
jgi:predicted permease